MNFIKILALLLFFSNVSVGMENKCSVQQCDELILKFKELNEKFMEFYNKLCYDQASLNRYLIALQASAIRWNNELYTRSIHSGINDNDEDIRTFNEINWIIKNYQKICKEHFNCYKLIDKNKSNCNKIVDCLNELKKITQKYK